MISAGKLLPSRRSPDIFSPVCSGCVSGSAKKRIRSSSRAARVSAGTSVSTARPMNSPAGYPNSRTAWVLAMVTEPSHSIAIMASGAASNSCRNRNSACSRADRAATRCIRISSVLRPSAFSSFGPTIGICVA